MSYRDALERCLQAVRDGATIEDAIAGYPREAGRLRADLRVAAAARRLAAELAGRAEAGVPGARLALQRQLAARRLAAPVASGRTAVPAPRLSFFFQGAAALAAVVLLAAGALAGGLPGAGSLFGGSVEAATLEGIVLEADGTRLTLQTQDAVESVSVDAGASITDPSGASLAPDSIEAGQAVTIKGRRLADASFAARRIRLDGLGGLQRWCSRFSDRCAEVERRLQPPPERCTVDPAACRRIEAQAEAIRIHLAAVARLDELTRRCRAEDDLAACRELLAFCHQHAAFCGDIVAWLRSLEQRLAELRDRLRDLIAACREGKAAECLALRRLCEQHVDLCPDGLPAPAAAPQPRPVTPREPAPSATPQRPPSTTAPERPRPTATKPPRDREPTPRPSPTPAVRPTR